LTPGTPSAVTCNDNYWASSTFTCVSCGDNSVVSGDGLVTGGLYNKANTALCTVNAANNAVSSLTCASKYVVLTSKSSSSGIASNNAGTGLYIYGCFYCGDHTNGCTVSGATVTGGVLSPGSLTAVTCVAGY